MLSLFKGKLLRLLVKGERNFKDFGGSPYLDRQKDEKLSDRDRKNKSFLSISQYLYSLLIIYATFSTISFSKFHFHFTFCPWLQTSQNLYQSMGDILINYYQCNQSKKEWLRVSISMFWPGSFFLPTERPSKKLSKKFAFL